MSPAALRMSGVTFTYPEGTSSVLAGVSLAVPEGSFALLVGATGSGKTTLLRLCKPEIAPVGELAGTIETFGRDVRALAPEESASLVGYVFQSPESQVVCDTVLREMAFGLENVALSQSEMRRRVAETCYFLGMETWLHSRTAELSGGQRQLLALAATLAMRPRLLLLDEPTSMLDPVAEQGFLAALFRANRELGVTVVVATHRPEAMLAYATQAFRMEGGSVEPIALDGLRRPTVAGGSVSLSASRLESSASVALEGRDLWFRYDRNAPWVLRDCDLVVRQGEVRALFGGNGSGKSTLLALASGVVRPQHGRFRNALAASQCLLPQDPQALLTQQSVGEELMEWAPGVGYGQREALATLERLGLLDGSSDAAAREALLARHPYDLSGGQMQLLALAKLLLARPRLLLLDEPTKGLDAHANDLMARALADARASGTTVVMATHDVRFARRLASTVSLLFDGEVALTSPCEEFFRESWVWRA